LLSEQSTAAVSWPAGGEAAAKERGRAESEGLRERRPGGAPSSALARAPTSPMSLRRRTISCESRGAKGVGQQLRGRPAPVPVFFAERRQADCAHRGHVHSLEPTTRLLACHRPSQLDIKCDVCSGRPAARHGFGVTWCGQRGAASASAPACGAARPWRTPVTPRLPAPPAGARGASLGDTDAVGGREKATGP
jgi:hypothetical protein